MSPRDRLPQTQGGTFLTDGGIETVLIFHQGIDLPAFAAFPLVDDEQGRAALRGYFEPYLELARDHRAGFVLTSPTWRANPDWAAEVGYDRDAMAGVNRRSIALMEELRDAVPSPQPVLIEGMLGPRAEGYAADTVMTAEEAERYHAVQLGVLADTAADFVSAITLTYADEATGVVRAAAKVGLPVSIAFTLETDGRLPSGQPLAEAIAQVDADAGGPDYYMLNCAHPAHFEHVLEAGAPWVERIRGLRANASRRSHEELDAAEELDEGDPAELAGAHGRLRDRMPALRVLGGCCGTDHRHVDAIAAAWYAAG